MIGIRGLAASALALAAGSALLSATPAGAVSVADRAATDSYLQARYEYAKAVTAGTPAAVAAFRAFASSLESECRDVLAGAEGKGRIVRGPSPREEGEQARLQHQRTAIEVELGRSASGAETAQLAPASMTFASSVSALRWSDPRVAAAVAREIEQTAASASGPSGPEVCADMRTWEQSGYVTLSARTLEIAAKEAALFESLHLPSTQTLLRRYEGASERSLIRRTEALGARVASARGQALEKGYLRLEAALTGKKPVPTVSRPKAFGKGTTSSGARFTVTPEARGAFKRRDCRAEISVEYSVSEQVDGGRIVATGGGGGLCIAGRAASKRPVLSCESGQLTLVQALPADVRRVRLRLADRRTLLSRVVPIPAKDGGPAALYVQALAADSSKPVAITELAADGSTIATIPVPAHGRCPTRKQEEPQTVALAHGTSPAGTVFTLTGEYATFEGGHGQFTLQLEDGVFGESQFRSSREPAMKQPFEPTFGGGCEPAGWSIVYGVLRAPAASVSAVSAHGEEPLRIVAIPARLHADGALAYGVFAEAPARLIVRDAGGRTLSSVDLTAEDKKRREYCEGYAEP